MEYTLKTAQTKTITYTRDFANDNWQALFLPFALDYGEWSATGEVAELVKYEDGKLTWRLLAAGEATVAGKPYIIKPGKLIIDDFGIETVKSLSVTASKALVPNTTIISKEVGAEGNKVTLSGTYAEKRMDTGNFWALSKGHFYYTYDPAKTLKPYRIFLTTSSKPSSSAPIRNFIICDGETTAIGEIEGVDIAPDAPAYSLQGLRVGKDYKGIVIVNGKKVLRK